MSNSLGDIYIWNTSSDTSNELLYTSYSTEGISNVFPTTNLDIVKYEDCLNKSPNYSITEKENSKEEKSIKMDFNFGKIKNNNFKMSLEGIAVKNKQGKYVTVKDEKILDVNNLVFEGLDCLYKVPVSLKEIKTGDMIIHNDNPYFVIDIFFTDKSLLVIDPYVGERKEILPVQSPFGFTFVTRVVNILDFFDKPNEDQPFGDMWPILTIKNDTDILPFLLMSKKDIDVKTIMPFLIKDNSNSNLLFLYLISKNPY